MISGLHRTSARAAQLATRSATHCARQLRELNIRLSEMNGQLSARTLTRATGGAAVGMALAATVAATSAIAGQDAAPSGAGLAIAAQHAGEPQTGSDLLGGAAVEEPAKPVTKAKKAVAAPKTVTAGEVIALAEQQVGIAESNGRGGGTKFQDWYVSTEHAQRTAERDGADTTQVYKDAAWCAMFITWLGDRFGMTDQMGADAWTVTHAEWFEEQGRFGQTPKPGAVVFFDWDGSESVDAIDHVGLVTGVNSDGSVNTVEGNISDTVVKKVRTQDTIVGYGYPDYATQDTQHTR